MRRRRDIRKSNMTFMYAVVAMAIVVLMVVGLFWYMCMPAKP